ncbi:MAG: phosphatidate cytidylyltransferase [Flavobacteriaceae bacterium]|jgi:phosphatidate cytidylyltransferase
MNNLLIRGLTGVVFVGAILGSIFWHPLAASVVFGIFMILGVIEFYTLFNKHENIDVSVGLGIASTIASLLIVTAGIYGLIPKSAIGILIFPLLFLTILIELWRKKDHPIHNLSITLLGFVYVALPFLLLIYVSFSGNEQFPLLAGMFILIWSNDTFAFLTGSVIGKTKLIERISPNKTWEGTIGGILMTILAGALIGYYTDAYLYWTIAAGLIASTSTLGDLIESMMKRSLNVKDSGNLLPGHGGILDRFDATLFTVPFFLAWNFIYLLLF